MKNIAECEVFDAVLESLRDLDWATLTGQERAWRVCEKIKQARRTIEKAGGE
jgi:hypothetical protein